MSQPPIAEFAHPGPLRDALVLAVLEGRKTSTTALLVQYAVPGEHLPAVGDRGTVVDSRGQAVCVIETVRTAIIPLAEVTVEHAVAEGEGYESVEAWRASHMDFWSSAEMRAELGEDFVIDDSTLVVCETFRVLPE